MHDAAMLAKSGFLHDLNTYAFSPMGIPLCVYGDPAYPLRIHLQAPFRNTARLTQQMELFNKSMSKVRMCSSRKYPYPPHGWSLEIPRGWGGGGGGL